MKQALETTLDSASSAQQLAKEITTLNLDNFKTTLENHPLVLVDFWAEWCEPCMAFTPVFEQLSKDNPQWQFGMVNVDSASEIADFFNVKQVPCLLAIKDRVVIDTVYGVMKPHELAHHLFMWESFDMQLINAHFDAKEAAV